MRGLKMETMKERNLIIVYYLFISEINKYKKETKWSNQKMSRLLSSDNCLR